MANPSKNAPTFASPNKRGAIFSHASGWCANPTITPTRSVTENTASQIDWRMVGVAGVMAGLFVVGSVLAAWSAARPRGLSKAIMTLSSPSQEGAGLTAVANAMDDKNRSTTSTAPRATSKTRSDNEGPSAASDQPQPIASYPEGDNRVVTGPAAALYAAPERPSQPEPDCETPPAIEFARDPMQAARLAREEHKLMLVLHVSGNFEESKFT